MIIVIVICSFISSYLITYLVRRYALSNGLQQEPNERSSHTVLTPHGGGIAIVVSFLVACIIGYNNGIFDKDIVLSISLCGGSVALVGFYDDHKPISVKIRILVQFICAVISIILLGGFPDISYGIFTLEFGFMGYIIGVFFIVWMTNLYNFMDGIDGFASLEAMTTTACMAFVLVVSTKFHSVWHLNNILVACVLGFFLWNFPKAKIFMGDVGSYFLGFVSAVIAIKSWHLTIDIIFSWVIILAVFITDATYTLLSRLIRGQNIAQAHKSHAYQIASRLLSSHVKVSMILVVINILWLFPIAYFVATKTLHPLTGLAISYLPLIALCWYLGAGKQELPDGYLKK